MIGQNQRRLEDPRLLRGTGLFVDDLSRPDQLHLRVVRSHLAHGSVLSIDTARAAEMPGVAAVLTPDDLRDVPPIGFRLNPHDDLLAHRQPVLAAETVRFVGEPVACVLAHSPYEAEDAAEQVFVDIEPIEPVLHPDLHHCADSEPTTTTPLVLSDGYGELDDAFDQAAHIVETTVRVGRHSAIPLECRGLLATWDDRTERLLVEGAAKVPFWNRDALARMLRLPPSQIVLREGHVGGGFGTRGELYPEDVLVAWAALHLGRSVKWIEDRNEHMIACNHARDQHLRLQAAVDSQGTILGLDVTFWMDQGAYVRTHGLTVPSLTATMLPGPYRIPAYRVRGHVCLTNKTPAGTYRSPGRFEGTFARERLMDRIATTLGIDLLEVRRRNLISPDSMPFRRDMDAMGTPITLDSGDYPLLLRRTEQAFNLSEMSRAAARRRDHGESVGVGLGLFVEKSGLGPSEGVRIEVDESGGIVAITGASSVGQGVQTMVAQVVADALQVDAEDVRVVLGQTDRFAAGRGAFATRLTVMAGSATTLAAKAVLDNALRRASRALEVDPNDLAYRQGSVVVRGAPGQHLTLAELARIGGQDGHPGLGAEEWFTTTRMTYPYGIHVAQVRVDPEVGNVTIERFVVVFDVGRAINPMMVRGQIVGGVAQGIGGTFYEQFLYSDLGQPLSTSFMDYLLPGVAEVPDVEVLITEDCPSPLNPLGVKGAGEGGINAVGAALAAAVDDALGLPGAVGATPILPADVRALAAGRIQSSAPEIPAPHRNERYVT